MTENTIENGNTQYVSKIKGMFSAYWAGIIVLGGISAYLINLLGSAGDGTAMQKLIAQTLKVDLAFLAVYLLGAITVFIGATIQEVMRDWGWWDTPVLFVSGLSLVITALGALICLIVTIIQACKLWPMLDALTN